MSRQSHRFCFLEFHSRFSFPHLLASCSEPSITSLHRHVAATVTVIVTSLSLSPSLSPSPSPSPSVVIDAEKEFEIKEVLNSKFMRSRLFYLVKWKGYPISENSWQPAINLKNAPELVNSFHSKYPTKPAPQSSQPTQLSQSSQSSNPPPLRRSPRQSRTYSSASTSYST